jgi:gas vesicle protein
MTRMMSTLQALLWGGTVGYVAGLLSAKKPGSELRQELSESSANFCRDCGESVNKLKSGASTQMRAIASESGPMKERMKGALDQVSEQAATLKEKAMVMKDKAMVMKENWSDTKEKLAVQGSAMKDKLAAQGSAIKETVVEQTAAMKNTVEEGMKPGTAGTTNPVYSGQTFDVSPGPSPTNTGGL